MTADSSEAVPPKKPFLLKNIFLFSRLLVVIAIVVLLLASIVVIVTGFLQLLEIIRVLLHEGIHLEETGTFLAVSVTEIIDLYLIGLVLIIFAFGLYQLFINPDINVPAWMETTSLDELKVRLLIVVAVILAVMFLGYAASPRDGIFIAGVGIAIAAVMIAVGYILRIAVGSHYEKKRLEMQGAHQEKQG
ncbi:YqhA family protein [bacterium]|nr:MAG: YqhA family protein [bacterium]